MATTVTRFRAGTAGTTDPSGVTPVTAGNTGIITNITLSNKTGGTRTATVTVGGYSFCTGLQIPANGTVNFDTRTVVNASEVLTIVSDQASSIDYFISGVIVSN
jgi:hypothetical protein